MSILGFGQNKKISDGDGSTDPNNRDNNGNNANQNGDQNSNQNGDGQEESFFSTFANESDADSDFNIDEDFFKTGDEGDDEEKQTQLTAEQQKIMNEVSEAMKADIGRAIMEDKDFNDFDVNDQSKIRSMFDKVMQRSAAAAVTAMMHPLQRTVEDAMMTLRKEFQAGYQANAVKSKAEQAFEPIQQSIMAGIKDKSMVAFAKNNFQMVLKQTKNAQRAQEATVALLKTMGFLVNRDGKPARKMNQFGSNDGMDFGSGGDSGSNRGIKTGNDALDSFLPRS